MALHPDFPDSPHAILNPDIRWFPADEALCDTRMGKLIVHFFCSSGITAAVAEKVTNLTCSHREKSGWLMACRVCQLAGDASIVEYIIPELCNRIVSEIRR
jgi:hypothetical protein